MSVITWYGHSAFKVEAGEVDVLLDPFFAPATHLGPRDVGHVDIVFLTHDHGDHVGETVSICRNTGAFLGCVVGTAETMIERGVPRDQILNGIGFNIGGTVCCRNVSATMTQAFHSSDSGVPAGYIIRMPDGLTFYHAGDTGVFSSMSLLAELYPLDVAMLPIGGVFTMDGFQAAKACALMRLKKVIPMHFATFPVLAPDTSDFRRHLEKLAPGCECVEMRIGESIRLEP